MLTNVIAIGRSLGSSLQFHAPAACAWSASGAEISTLALLDRAVQVRATDYVDLVAALPMPDSLTAVMIERDGGIWRADVRRVGRADAALVAQLPGPALGGCRHPDFGWILVLGAAGAGLPAVFALQVETGVTTAVVSGLIGARGIAPDADARVVAVLGSAADGTDTLTLITIDDAGSSTVPVPAGVTAVVSAPDGDGVIVAVADEASPDG